MKIDKNRNARIEKHYFEMFRRIYQLPEGKVIYGDKPDIVIEGKKRVGIEITNFFLEDGNLPESEQVQRKIRERVVSDTQKIYQSKNGKKLQIVFSFDNLKPILDEKKLKKELVKLSKKIEDFETGEIAREIFKGIPELSFVYLNSESYDGVRWSVQQVYEGKYMSRDRIIKLVRVQAEKVKKYKYCDAYWLLVVVDFIDFAQDQEIEIKNFSKIKTEKFEKVIVYKTVFEHILEVK
ncbi:MAG: hypothetical protein H8E12_19015 [Rhodobacteraceae bacterium]|nr:hypothetical protein [Paracoccaceae bacterium]